jgi:hypothetical protein
MTTSEIPKPTTKATHTSATIPAAPRQPVAHKEAVDRGVNTPVLPNINPPSPTAYTHVAEPALLNKPQHETQADLDRKDARKWGYSVGTNAVKPSIKVRNIHTHELNLEGGIIPIDGTGLATPAEVSCLTGQYVEVV